MKFHCSAKIIADKITVIHKLNVINYISLAITLKQEQTKSVNDYVFFFIVIGRKCTSSECIY